LIHFSHNSAQLLLKTCCLSANLKLTLLFKLSISLAFLDLGGLSTFTLLFGRQIFTKLRAGKHSRSHNDLNTMTITRDWLKASLYQLSCVMFGGGTWKCLFYFILWYWGSNSGSISWVTPPAFVCVCMLGFSR
jgi:hypothetical protein